jgi:peptide/nickel transport system permease protein
VNVYDSINAPTTYTLNLDNAAAKRIASKLNEEDRVDMKEWLVARGIPEEEIDIADTRKLLGCGKTTTTPRSIPRMTNAKRNYYPAAQRLDHGLLSTEGAIIAVPKRGNGRAAGEPARCQQSRLREYHPGGERAGVAAGHR